MLLAIVMLSELRMAVEGKEKGSRAPAELKYALVIWILQRKKTKLDHDGDII